MFLPQISWKIRSTGSPPGSSTIRTSSNGAWRSSGRPIRCSEYFCCLLTIQRRKLYVIFAIWGFDCCRIWSDMFWLRRCVVMVELIGFLLESGDLWFVFGISRVRWCCGIFFIYFFNLKFMRCVYLVWLSVAFGLRLWIMKRLCFIFICYCNQIVDLKSIYLFICNWFC